MRAIFEAVTPEPGASWAFLDRQLAEGIPFEWHHHPEYELTLTLNSRGHRYIGDDIDAYEDGDLILIGPGIPHSWCSHEAVDDRQPHSALVCWFTDAWLAALMATCPETGSLAQLLARASQGLAFSLATRSAVTPLIQEMRRAQPPQRLILLLSVFDILRQDPDARTLANIPQARSIDLVADERLLRVLNHLHAHFTAPIRIAHMAELACVSASAFHRLFRRHVHMTMVDYLMRLRVGRACSLLIGTAQPITGIAADVGYTNMALFNRQFSRLKAEAPSEFRKRHSRLTGSTAPGRQSQGPSGRGLRDAKNRL